ncbi:MAG TPA: Bax inhibitor-1/YccA family protein [Bacteroidales bacterium]|nr:Bax inhibitor-1/YccA family protein [Bacteroidales bacterium]HPT09054.1 Bax inhibitor-1/YccA family protein [Bacteroidales bacterium]
MMFEQSNNNNYFTTPAGGREMVISKSFMAQVFGWMSLAMAVTALTAFWFASSESLIRSLVNSETGGLTGLGWFVTLAPIGFVLLMSFGFQRLSGGILTLLFLAFAVLMGMSLSFILLVYTSASVFKTFAVTTIMFGVMAVTGYTTKTDLTKFGSIMMMGLIGLMVAMLINFFMQSAAMDYIISIIGVLIFTGLTAYDVQRLKKIGSGAGEYGTENVRKLSILGALTLYLDFINLFLFLLRFMGDRK